MDRGCVNDLRPRIVRQHPVIPSEGRKRAASVVYLAAVSIQSWLLGPGKLPARGLLRPGRASHPEDHAGEVAVYGSVNLQVDENVTAQASALSHLI